ncbi:MAG: hypothetical protein ACN4GW_21540 [Desulforhopalus sp.]
MFSKSSRSRQEALLLLAVLDCIENVTIGRNFINLSPGLEQRFHDYCIGIMPPGQRVNLASPFFSLGRTSFWELKPRPGTVIEKTGGNITLSELRTDFFGAKFSDDLYPLLQMATFRGKLRQVLLQTYFNSDEQQRIHHHSATISH